MPYHMFVPLSRLGGSEKQIQPSYGLAPGAQKKLPLMPSIPSWVLAISLLLY